jgi:predicted AlkP superfamily phosphohydrolase/phosphomutase
VRYLRLLSNSMAAALLAAGYVFTVMLQLNPTLPLDPLRLFPLALTVVLFYAANLTVFFYGCLVLRELFAREPLSPAWLSVTLLSWLAAASAAAGALLMWLNVRNFELALSSATIDVMFRGMLIVASAGVLFVVIGVLRVQSGSVRRMWALLLAIVATCSLGVPIAIRGRSVPALPEAPPPDLNGATSGDVADVFPGERSAHVTILAVDAASLELITNATSDGRLPNFGQLLDAGAVMHLATIHPTSPEAVWAAAATGKLPQKNGVRSLGTYRVRRLATRAGRSDAGGAHGPVALQLLPEFCYANSLLRFGLLVEEPHTSAAFRARPFWSVLSALKIPVAVAGWPLTQPAPPVFGYLVSDAYPRRVGTSAAADDPSSVYPPDALPELADVIHLPPPDDIEAVQAVRGGVGETPGRVDRMVDQIVETLESTRPTQVAAIRYQSLDPIGHHYLRYATPSAFGDVTDDERRSLGSVLEAHYALIDAAIGRAMSSLGPDDLLLVVSGYGMEPLGLGKRLLERLLGDPELSGTHDHGPDGFLIAYGASVARNRNLPRGSVVDLVPTMLYFMGLPIGRDMDGFARTDIFQPAFSEAHAMTYIPTYDR